MKTLVLYGSRYGRTEAYAKHIAQALGCRALPVGKAKRKDMAEADVVLFGGGVYAGSIAGWSKAARLLRRAKDKRIVLFVCGLADPAKEKTQREARMLFEKKLPPEQKGTLPVFCLRGGIQYTKLGLKHRAMMAMLIAYLKKKRDKSEEDKQLLSSYGGEVEFTDLSSARPVIEEAERLSKDRNTPSLS